jgi:hypothetical protein
VILQPAGWKRGRSLGPARRRQSTSWRSTSTWLALTDITWS